MKKSWITKLDKIWSFKVKELAGFKCEHCLRDDDFRLESAHIIGRASVLGGRSTRWGAWIDNTYDLNGMCLCITCHQHYDNHGKLHDSIFNNCIGKERYAKLCQVGDIIAKDQDPEEIKSWIESVRTVAGK